MIAPRGRLVVASATKLGVIVGLDNGRVAVGVPLPEEVVLEGVGFSGLFVGVGVEVEVLVRSLVGQPPREEDEFGVQVACWKATLARALGAKIKMAKRREINTVLYCFFNILPSFRKTILIVSDVQI